jgi:hypothetical protein
MVPGAEMEPLILADMHEATDDDPHELLATTHILPPTVPDVTLTDVAPCPLLIDQPVGTVHV